jgi:hypothetical protein
LVFGAGLKIGSPRNSEQCANRRGYTPEVISDLEGFSDSWMTYLAPIKEHFDVGVKMKVGINSITTTGRYLRSELLNSLNVFVNADGHNESYETLQSNIGYITVGFEKEFEDRMTTYDP